MAIVIKPKRTTTTGAPTTSNIADGEWCINLTDRVIYVRSGSSIIPVASLTAIPRTVAATSTATLTPNADTTDLAILTAQAAALAVAAPTGTPANGQKLMFRFKDNGTARAISWNAIFRAVGVTLPTTTVLSKTLYVGCVYNSADTKWDVLAVGQE